MNGKLLGGVLLLATAVLFVGCSPAMPPLDFKPQAMSTGKFVPKVDNFQIIMDASMSTDNRGQRDFKTIKNLVSSINNSIPTDLTYNGGLRSFGHSTKQSKTLTDLVYGMTKYTRDGLQGGLDSVKYAGGNSPLGAALEAAGNDLATARGKSAIIVVSDGLQMSSAPAAAAKIKEQLGGNVCIYTVWVGDSPAGKKLLENVAKAGGCGSAYAAKDLTDSGKLGAFVETVFLAPKPKAKEGPCPDSDGDGVCDAYDKCPGTLPGVMVDKDGCALKYTLQIEFDFDKADIRPEYHNKIAEAAAFVKRYPATKILVAGHTDSTGEADYNKELSMKRAESLEVYMAENFGVNAEQLYPRGYGESRPVATNDTKEGRQMNRRVEFICCTLIPPE